MSQTELGADTVPRPGSPIHIHSQKLEGATYADTANTMPKATPTPTGVASGATKAATTGSAGLTPEAASVDSDTDSIYKDTAKPVFLKNRDVLPAEGKVLSHEELYLALHKQLKSLKNLKGLQKIGGLWRIYLNDRVDRIALISSGLNVRGTLTPIYDTNPYLQNAESPTMRITVKDIPLSVNDDVIINELEKLKIKVKSRVQRMKLRVNGFLTECYNGDRTIYVEKLKQCTKFCCSLTCVDIISYN